LSEELDKYEGTISAKYGDKPDEILERVPRIRKPTAALQLLNETLQRTQEQLRMSERLRSEEASRARVAEKKLAEVEHLRNKLEARKARAKRRKKKKKPAKKRGRQK
jgi:hypothetical protein